MKKIKSIKYHKTPLAVIKNLRKPKWVSISKSKSHIDGIKGYLRPYKKNFSIDFEKHIRGGEMGDIRNIQFKIKKEIYIAEKLFIVHVSPPKHKGIIDSFHTIGFSPKKKFYYRLLIPLEKELRFHYNIEQVGFISDLGYSSRTSTIATIEGDKIEVCCISTDKRKEFFLVIESEKRQNYEEFSHKANAIQIALGYLSGYYAGNQGYFFAYSKKEKKDPKYFKFTEFRDSIKSTYSPVYSNSYGYLHGYRREANRFYKILRPVTLSEFSILCERINKSSDFSSTLILILESSIASLLFMPGGFAISLETMSDIILGKDKLKMAPIKDKVISRKIREKFKRIVEEHSGLILSDDIKTLFSRIENFNQITNKSRLKAPFNKLEILLNEEDLKVLESRNDFLHGRVPDFTKEGKIRSTDRINRDLYYASMRFYTLLSLLILKWIGYDNYIVNHAKLKEAYTKIKLDEKGYRKV